MEKPEICLDPLPAGFMLPKPVNSVKDEVVRKLANAERLAITRKRDGYRVWAVKAERVKLYTRGMQEITDYFPHIVVDLESILPPQTFLDGEMIIEKGDRDDFASIQKLFAPIFKGASPMEAISPHREIGSAKYMIFGIVFWNGEKYIARPWREQHAKITEIFRDRSFSCLVPIELLNCSFEEAQELVKEKGWEGLVLYDKKGCSDYRLDGKVGRPSVCWKRKPVREDDFIVRRWIARPNDPSMVKEFVLSQIDSKSGKEIDCGKCGTGLSNKERAELAHENLYPLVIEVQFFERFPTGKLRFHSFIRVRDDKKPEECIFQKELEGNWYMIKRAGSSKIK